MGYVRLANGNIVDEATLPIRNGQPYDPTASDQAELAGRDSGSADTTPSQSPTPQFQNGQANPSDPRYVWNSNTNSWNLKPGETPGKMDQTAAGQKQISDSLSTKAGITVPTSTSKPVAKPTVTRMDDTSAGTTGGVTVPKDSGPGSEGGFRIRMKGPDGQYTFTRDVSQIDQLIKQGYKVIRDDGSEAEIKAFNGGTLIDGRPINTVLTGKITQAQYDALKAGGIDVSDMTPDQIDPTGGTIDGKQVVPQANSTDGNSPSTSPPFIPPTDPAIGTSAKNDFQKLLGDSLARTQGADTLSTDARGFSKDMVNRADAAAATRDKYVNSAIPGLTDTINYFMANKDKAEGLSPENMAALRLQQNQGIPDRFNQAARTMSTQLLRSGADTGVIPGSSGDIVRAYAPLYGDRASAYAKSNQDIQLADANAKIQSLLSNRQLASSAVGAGSNLMSTMGNMYNPQSYLGDATNGMNTAISAFNAGTSNLTGLGLGSASGLSDLEPTSFKNMLLASLLSTGTNALTSKNADGTSTLSKIWNFIKGLGGGGAPSNGDNTDPGSGPGVNPTQIQGPLTNNPNVDV